jgi:hypothetical protein
MGKGFDTQIRMGDGFDTQIRIEKDLMRKSDGGGFDGF